MRFSVPVMTSSRPSTRLSVYKLIATSFGARTIEVVQPGLSAGLGRNAGRGHTENPAHFRPEPK